MNAAIFNQRLRAAADAIRDAESAYRDAIAEAAETERRYKQAEAMALIRVSSFKNAADRAAQAELLEFPDDDTLGDFRYRAHLAEGLKDAAKLALRNRGSELSALQSEAALAKQEMQFAQFEPRETATA